MNLQKQISERLEKISTLTIFGYAVKEAINKDFESCVRMIADQAKDNRKVVSGIVSEETLTLIEKYLKGE